MGEQSVNSFTVSGDNYTKLVATAKAKGLDIEGDSGEVTYDHIKFGYKYDGSILTITVLNKPFFVSYSEIDNHLNQLYHEAING